MIPVLKETALVVLIFRQLSEGGGSLLQQCGKKNLPDLDQNGHNLGQSLILRGRKQSQLEQLP